MFNFRPMTDVPGFRVGQTEDTPGFAVDPNGLVPPYDPGAPIGDGSSTGRDASAQRRLLCNLRLLEICAAKASLVAVNRVAIGEPRPRIAWKVAIYARNVP